jgi:hypothetical protein
MVSTGTPAPPSRASTHGGTVPGMSLTVAEFADAFRKGHRQSNVAFRQPSGRTGGGEWFACCAFALPEVRTRRRFIGAVGRPDDRSRLDS